MGGSFKGKEGAFRQDVKCRWRRPLTISEENQGSVKNKTSKGAVYSKIETVIWG